MKNAKRGRGSHRGVYLGIAAALGFALSGCGGGPGGSGGSGAASLSQSSSLPTVSNGTATLQWLPPTENTDGSPLTNLAGYDIHYGTQSHSYTETIQVANPGIATYVVDNLTPGTYYFAVSAISAGGTESPLSAEVSTIVN